MIKGYQIGSKYENKDQIMYMVDSYFVIKPNQDMSILRKLYSLFALSNMTHPCHNLSQNTMPFTTSHHIELPCVQGHFRKISVVCTCHTLQSSVHMK